MTEKPTYEELEQRIKELEQAAIELKRSEELFRGLFANMTSGSAIYEVVNDGLKGSDYIVKGFNNKSLEIEGKTLEQVVGKTLFDLRPNIDDYGLILAMKKVWETGLSAYHPVKLYKDNNFSNYYENYIFKTPSGEIVTIYNDITVQKNQEIALKESKERFELAMNFTNDGLFDWNLETNQIHYSSGWKRMLGYSDDEIKDEFSEWERLTKFEDMKASWDMMNELLEGKRGHFEKEFKMQHKDGHWVDILSRANVVFNKDGKGVRVVGTHVDITEQKRIEEELRVSVIKHKTILEALPVGVTVSDDAENIVESNNAAQKMLGLSREEHLKRKIQGNEWSIIREDGSPMPSDEFASVRALKERHLVENVIMGIVKEDNEVTWISVSSTPVPLEGYGVAIAFIDITERKRTEEKYLTLFREMLDGFALHEVICDENGKPIDYKFLTVNPAFERITGLKAADIVGKRVLDVLPDIEKYWIEIYSKVAITGEPAFFENYSNELKKHFEVKAFRPAYGQFACIISDITKKKQAEIKQQELEAANLRLQKAESLSQMAGGIAHLFNNYLYAVSGNLELALEELPDDSLIRDNLTEAMKAVNRCADVSGSMLTYLGQSVVKAESINISEFCQKHLPNLQSSFNNNISIDTNLSDTELLVRANSNQMQQILNHLIINAYESIGDNKGKISLNTKTIPASNISNFHLLPVDCKPSAKTYACVEVTDTGCGISKEDINKLSDPFFTTKFTGRGLGLAIISGIVKSWGGCIGVKSKVGYGSTFMVFLPIYVDNSVRQSKKLSQSRQPQQKKLSTVLLVDDHEMVRNMTTAMLKRMGFEVISAVNGVEAVKLFRKHKESVGCLITDLAMPELDGWGTLSEIRKINPAIPAILASGYDEAFAMSSDTSEKPQAFLHKPYSMADLKSALGQALESLS